MCADAGGNAPDGTGCGTNQVCNTGACVTCQAGMSCTPNNPCHTGALSCATGTPLCSDTGSNLPDGTGCGAGR